jgi:hypothetical protein
MLIVACRTVIEKLTSLLGQQSATITTLEAELAKQANRIKYLEDQNHKQIPDKLVLENVNEVGQVCVSLYWPPSCSLL